MRTSIIMEAVKPGGLEPTDDLDYLLPPNCPNTYYDTWDRHNSIAFTTAAKGLHNAPGENNCFVNSAVQVFWHLDVFRRSYRRLSGHTCMGNSCIFCALKVIFTQFQFSDQSSLHPDALRKALADTFANQQRFQLGHMDDAAECFENILKRIHFHVANNTDHEDTCTAPHCLSHQKFSLSILEKVVCPCGSSSKPLQYGEMVHYISASALVSQAQLMQESGDILHPDRFGLLLRNANALGDMRRCPGACGKTVQIRRTLLNSPDVVSIGLGWDSDHPSVEMTTKVAQTIGTAIYLHDVFHSVMQDIRSLPKLQLVGLVCYYGKHYSTFVFHSKLQVWIYFDDATVKEIGPSFDQVVDKCTKGRYQPLLLLYANPNATPVLVDTAPKKRVMAPGYGLPGAPDDESSLDRTHESISSQHSYQRALTPNLESSSSVKEQLSYPRARSVTPSSYESSRNSISSLSPVPLEHGRQQSFIMAMSSTKSDKTRHPLRLGGQATVGGSGTPGPMTPVMEADGQRGSAFHQPSQADSYADYTLSTSDQYRRPSMTGFQPEDLPLTPNLKGESPRKESNFKKGKEPFRADVVRCHVEDNHDCISKNNMAHMYQNLEGKQSSQNPAGNRGSLYYPGSVANHHARQRLLSQGDEAYASDSSTFDGQPQHTIVKPMAAGHPFDQEDGRASYTHTAVQSGLATLPKRKKNPSLDTTTSNHSHQTSSSTLEATSRQGSLSNLASFSEQRPMSSQGYIARDEGSRRTPTNDTVGLPPPCPPKNISANEQGDGNGKKSSDSDKKSKKLKKEQKKAEKKKQKSITDPSIVEDFKQSLILCQEDIGAEEDPGSEHYINRKMVANVMKHQGLQRQPSTHSTNSQASSSSIESDSIMRRLLASRQGEGGSHTDVSFDNVSIGSHKDSGYGSSDRNSSSSTGSGTVDPHVQYFLSKSMVVPRNLNTQFLEYKSQQAVSDFTAPNPQVYPGMYKNQADTNGKDFTRISKEDKNRGHREHMTQRKVMHPIKESSQEDVLKIMPKDFPANSNPLRGSSPSVNDDPPSKEFRAPPIPPKNFAAFQVSKSSHHREPSIDSLDKEEVKNDYFISMCEKADDLMDRCILVETQEDLTSALCFCDSALGCLKEAMNQTDISNKALVYAQKKHNSCLLKSRSLFKRSSGHGSSDSSSTTGKRASITSTDSDNSEKSIRRVASRERLLPSHRPSSHAGQGGMPVPHQPTSAHNSSVDSLVVRQSPLPMTQPLDGNQNKIDNCMGSIETASTHFPAFRPGEDSSLKCHVSRIQAAEQSDSVSNHSRSGSNSSVHSSVSVPCSLSQAPSQGMSKSQSCVVVSSGGYPPNSAFTLDKCGTEPRNRKSRRTSDPTGNAEVYHMYLNKQKTPQTEHGAERSFKDGRESDSSSSDGNPQKKASKLEIKEMLGNNVVKLQKHNLSRQINGNEDEKTVNSNQSLEAGSRGQYNVDPRYSQGSTSVSSSVPTPLQPSTYLKPSIAQPLVAGVAQARMNTSTPPQLHHSSQFQHGSPHTTNNNAPTSRQSNNPRQNFINQQNQQQQHFHPPQQLPPPSSSAASAFPHPAPYMLSGYNQPLPGQRVGDGNPHPQNKSPVGVVAPFPPDQSIPHQSSSQMNPGAFPQATTSSTQLLRTSSNYSSQNVSTQNSIPPPHQPVNSSKVHPSYQISPTSHGSRNGGMQPPPPPVRKSSNPDFKNNLNSDPRFAVQQTAQSQRIQHNPCVQPHHETDQYYPQSGHPYNNSHHIPGNSVEASTAFLQTKHASSNPGMLNTILPMSQQPAEHFVSQSFKQSNLMQSADVSHFPTPPSHSSYTSNMITATNQGIGQHVRLAQTFDHSSHMPIPNPTQLSNAADESSECQQSVKTLLSKFDQRQKKPAVRPKPVSIRLRSKSESGNKKPKSVLKSKKAKSANKSRKSVTFADDFSTRASGYESAAELTTFSSSSHISERAYFSDDEEHLGSLVTSGHSNQNDIDDVEDSSNSDDYAIPHEELACQLCGKREIEPGKGYCSKCSSYMARLSSS